MRRGVLLFVLTTQIIEKIFMALVKNFVSLREERLVGFFFDCIVQIDESFIARFKVGVDVKTFSEVIEFVRRVQCQECPQAFWTPAAIRSLFQTDVQIFLRNRVVGYKINFIVAVALTAR